VQGASPLRRAGIASLVTGGMLGVLSATALSFGFEAERMLRAEPHTRAQADALLLERSLAATIAYPSLVLGAAGLAAGVTCLIWDDAGLSDGNEEVLP
jgi:TRAP-type C4-dicarboxylate transport system permease large subunit